MTEAEGPWGQPRHVRPREVSAQTCHIGPSVTLQRAERVTGKPNLREELQRLTARAQSPRSDRGRSCNQPTTTGTWREELPVPLHGMLGLELTGSGRKEARPGMKVMTRLTAFSTGCQWEDLGPEVTVLEHDPVWE